MPTVDEIAERIRVRNLEEQLKFRGANMSDYAGLSPLEKEQLLERLDNQWVYDAMRNSRPMLTMKEKEDADK